MSTIFSNVYRFNSYFDKIHINLEQTKFHAGYKCLPLLISYNLFIRDLMTDTQITEQQVQEYVRYFYFNKPFYEALKYMTHRFAQDGLQIEFIDNNRLKIQGWQQGKEECKKLQDQLFKTVDLLSVLKIPQPDKKVQRIKMMKKWRKRFQIEALNIITFKKNFGYAHYLVGFTTQRRLYNILTMFQSHSYKVFTSNFIKFLYKPIFEALVYSKDYQIAIFQKLKITSTQLRIVQLQNSNKKRGKFVEFMFELKEYTPTKIIVEKFKQFLVNQIVVCGLIIQKQKVQQVKNSLTQLDEKITGWKMSARKKEGMNCAYVVLKKPDALSLMTEVLNKFIPERIVFLKGIGKENSTLQPYYAQASDKYTNSDLMKIFKIAGNAPKTPNEISLALKQEKQPEEAKKAWIQGLSLVF